MACAEALLTNRHDLATRGWPSREWVDRQQNFVENAAAGRSSDELTVEGFTLIGREWLRARKHPELVALEKAVYGAQVFEPLVFPEACESARLWGYPCPFERADIAADHLFPRSLGGPTDARNRLTLCRWHNTAKSMDVHVYPWEEGAPEWLPQLLSVMNRWMHAGTQ